MSMRTTLLIKKQKSSVKMPASNMVPTTRIARRTNHCLADEQGSFLKQRRTSASETPAETAKDMPKMAFSRRWPELSSQYGWKSGNHISKLISAKNTAKDSIPAAIAEPKPSPLTAFTRYIAANGKRK